MADGGAVRLIGELDLAAAPKAKAALARARGDLVVDCSTLTFLDAAGLGVLVCARRTCQAAGGELLLVDPAPCVTRLLGLTGLDQHFSIHWSGEKR